MFSGQSCHVLDAKSRLIVPSRYRTSLGDRFYISRSINAHDCIWMMPEKDFEDMISQLSSKIQTTDTQGQRWLTRLVGAAYLCEVDRQGRIVIPQNLRNVCGIDDENVTLIGVINRVEIWSTLKRAEIDETDFLEDTKFVNEKYNI